MIGKLLDKLALLATSRPTFHFKGEESVRDKAAWQASSSKKRHLRAPEAQRAHISKSAQPIPKFLGEMNGPQKSIHCVLPKSVWVTAKK
jgi:hypothetical protein